MKNILLFSFIVILFYGAQLSALYASPCASHKTPAVEASKAPCLHSVEAKQDDHKEEQGSHVSFPCDGHCFHLCAMKFFQQSAEVTFHYDMSAMYHKRKPSNSIISIHAHLDPPPPKNFS
jgi:hypothetical protein